MGNPAETEKLPGDLADDSPGERQERITRRLAEVLGRHVAHEIRDGEVERLEITASDGDLISVVSHDTGGGAWLTEIRIGSILTEDVRDYLATVMLPPGLVVSPTPREAP